ncbi:hypothetical protein [Nonomuraea angiospora]
MTDSPLLHYSTSTAPLQAGSPDKPAANTIDITVSSPAGQKIYCKKLEIAVPISAPDDGGAYFTENPQSSITGKWGTASAQMKIGQELGLQPDTNYYHVIFQAPPIPGFDLIDKPLTISITGNIAATPGSTLTCPTTETSGTTSGKYTPKTPQDLTWDTAKPAFYLHNFLASAPDKPTIPKTKYNAGDEVYLSWESNGTYFRLYDGDGTILNPNTPSETFHLIPKAAIANDTTFTLQASETQESIGIHPVYQYATITITINNPTLSQMTVTNGTHTPWVQGVVDGQKGRVTFSDAGVEVHNKAGSSGTLQANKVQTDEVHAGKVQADKADFYDVNTASVQGRNTDDAYISFSEEGLTVRRAGGSDGTVFAGKVQADKAAFNGVNTNWVQGKSTDDGWISFPEDGLHVYKGQGNQNWGTVAADKADLNTLKVKYL